MPVPTFAQLKPEYRRLWDSMKIDPGKDASITTAARKVIAGRARYEAVARRIGARVPWEFIGITHLMEAGGDFTCHPHNGDPLTRRTRQVPANRPAAGNPPFTWEESAFDCYGVLKKLGDVIDWSVEHTLYLAELFNGMGYRQYHAYDLSPYLWARTNHNDGTGKYVADGRYDRNAPSEGQCGFAPVLCEVWRLTGKDSEGRPLATTAPDAPKTTAKVTTAGGIFAAIAAFITWVSGIDISPAAVGITLGAAVVVALAVVIAIKLKG